MFLSVTANKIIRYYALNMKALAIARRDMGGRKGVGKVLMERASGGECESEAPHAAGAPGGASSYRAITQAPHTTKTRRSTHTLLLLVFFLSSPRQMASLLHLEPKWLGSMSDAPAKSLFTASILHSRSQVKRNKKCYGASCKSLASYAETKPRRALREALQMHF